MRHKVHFLRDRFYKIKLSFSGGGESNDAKIKQQYDKCR